VKEESLAKKQARLAREKAASQGHLPPWKQASYDNTNVELNSHTAENMVHLVGLALELEGCPADELREIRKYAKTAILAFDRVRNSAKGAETGRAKANRLYLKAQELIDKLDNKTGFDLWEKSTWVNSDTPDKGSASNR